MYVNRWSLNLQQAKGYMNPLNARPVNFMHGNALYGAESAAMGGSQFQHHRDIRGNMYVKDSLATENGYISVDLEEVCSKAVTENPCKLAFVHGCLGCNEALIAHDSSILNVISQVDGSLILEKGVDTFERCNNVTGYCDYTSSFVKPEGIELDSPHVKGMVKVGIRTVIWTDKEIYFNGQEDFYKYTPAMRDGAGKLSVVFDIGSIVQLVSFGNGFYVLGSRGGLYTKTCTGDIQYPFEFHKIDNFNGIHHKDCCLSEGEMQDLFVMSHNTMQVLQVTKASNILPDESVELLHGTVTSTQWLCQPEDEIERGCVAQEVQRIPNNLIEVDEEEFGDDLDAVLNCEGNLPFFIVRSLKDTDKQHVAVHNLDSVYVAISFGTCSTECTSDDCVIYSRLLVYNKSLDRYTILHLEHTDVIRSTHKDRYPFIVMQQGKAMAIKEGEGLGEILFSDLIRSSGKASTISQVSVIGDLNVDNYKKELVNALQYIPFGTGVDHLQSQYHTSMERSAFGYREAVYDGRIVDKRISFILPFSGRINELILNVI